MTVDMIQIVMKMMMMLLYNNFDDSDIDVYIKHCSEDWIHSYHIYNTIETCIYMYIYTVYRYAFTHTYMYKHIPLPWLTR